MKRKPALACLLLASTALIGFGQDWPQFRGPGGLGISGAKGLPIVWSQKENIVWKMELPGAGSSSPIVVGERVFVTCYSGYAVPGQPSGTSAELKRHLVCLNRSDGKEVWAKTFRPALPEQSNAEHGYSSSTPASDGERVFVFFAKSGVFALDLAGRQLWHANVGSKRNSWGSAASPILYRGLVIVNASVESESLVALDRLTGKEVWRATGIHEAWNTPALVEVAGGKKELVITVRDKVLSFDPDTGQSLWSCVGVPRYVCPSVVAHDGVIYAVLGSRTVALRAGGRGDVTASHVLWTANRGSGVSSPVYYNGHLYFVTIRGGIVNCLDAKTGKVAYEKRLTPAPDRIYASPLLADGKLYFLTREEGAYVLAAQPRFEQLAHNQLGDPNLFNASPAVAGNRLFLRSDRYLYCLGKQ